MAEKASKMQNIKSTTDLLRSLEALSNELEFTPKLQDISSYINYGDFKKISHLLGAIQSIVNETRNKKFNDEQQMKLNQVFIESVERLKIMINKNNDEATKSAEDIFKLCKELKLTSQNAIIEVALSEITNNPIFAAQKLKELQQNNPPPPDNKPSDSSGFPSPTNPSVKTLKAKGHISTEEFDAFKKSTPEIRDNKVTASQINEEIQFSSKNTSDLCNTAIKFIKEFPDTSLVFDIKAPNPDSAYNVLKEAENKKLKVENISYKDNGSYKTVTIEEFKKQFEQKPPSANESSKHGIR